MPKLFQTPAELRKESRRQQIAAMLMRGVTNQARIARELGCAPMTVISDLRVIRQQWRTETVAFFNTAKDEQLKKIDKIEENAWKGWEFSRRPASKIINKTDPDGLEDITEVTEGQAGDPRFLEIVRKCVEDRRKMLGLDEPDRIDVKGQIAVAAIQLQKAVENNGSYIEYERQRLLEGSIIPGLFGGMDQQRTLEASPPLDLVGYPIGANGNGKPALAAAAMARPRYRLDGSGNGQAD
jgi:hypothetical protein